MKLPRATEPAFPPGPQALAVDHDARPVRAAVVTLGGEDLTGTCWSRLASVLGGSWILHFYQRFLFDLGIILSCFSSLCGSGCRLASQEAGSEGENGVQDVC